CISIFRMTLLHIKYKKRKGDFQYEYKSLL
ncbi:unnamed protein product, partial [marine sediment metagenome]